MTILHANTDPDLLTAQALARIRETACLPRRGRGGRMESADAAQARGTINLAIVGVMADGGLRRSEAAALTCGTTWTSGRTEQLASRSRRARTSRSRGPGRRLLRAQRSNRHGPKDGGRRSAERSGPEPWTLEEGLPQSWEHVHYTRPEVDQAEAVITWHGDLIRSYAVQAASEKVTRLANETITMLREKREKVQKEDGSIAARNIIARLGKSELRTGAGLREQVIDVLVVHRHLIPTARRGHYMMVVPHD